MKFEFQFCEHCGQPIYKIEDVAVAWKPKGAIGLVAVELKGEAPSCGVRLTCKACARFFALAVGWAKQS